ncbi:hypothetical protein AC1031_009966 [Aphanomyces cochlioides]|nr:hypothetical protein AC1031_009966 [Aphanomyces cochlioides]
MIERADMDDGTEGEPFLSSGDERESFYDFENSQVLDNHDNAEEINETQAGTSNETSQFVRPIVAKRSRALSIETSFSVMKMIEIQMIMDEKRRQDERDRREEERRERETERRQREEERREERAQRDEEKRERDNERRKKHTELMSVLALILGSKQS